MRVCLPDTLRGNAVLRHPTTRVDRPGDAPHPPT